jgi:type II secretory pathway pseudopilin PulG
MGMKKYHQFYLYATGRAGRPYRQIGNGTLGGFSDSVCLLQVERRQARLAIMTTMKGLTLIEMVLVLAAILLVSAILVPRLGNYIDHAKAATAQSDVRAIGEAILRFEKDVGRLPMFPSGSGFLADSAATVVRMESSAGSYPTTSAGNVWISATPTDAPDCTPTCTFHTMGILLANAIGYPSTSSLAKPNKWKGPYMDVGVDPWGRKYLVNIINGKSSSVDAVFVISAGVNGVIETSFNRPRTGTVTPVGDDILFRIR